MRLIGRQPIKPSEKYEQLTVKADQAQTSG